MISENNTSTEFPSINLTKNLSKAQGLVRFILDNQQEKLKQAGDVTALDAIRDTLRVLNQAHDDLTDLLQEHRDDKQQMLRQAFTTRDYIG